MDGSTTTMELSIAITVLAVAVCFVCFAVFCLFYARFALQSGARRGTKHRRGTAEERQSVMSSPVDFKYGTEMTAAVRPSATTPTQCEIEVSDHEETGRGDADSVALPPPKRSAKRRRKSRRSASKSAKPGKDGKGAKYQKVERNAFDFGDDAKFAPKGPSAAGGSAASQSVTVSPPTSLSMLRQRIPVQDVQPAFYVPGMHLLASPPLPPQPDTDRLRAIPKHCEMDGDGDGAAEPEVAAAAFIASPTVTALSEVTESTKWDGDEERDSLVGHSADI